MSSGAGEPVKSDKELRRSNWFHSLPGFSRGLAPIDEIISTECSIYKWPRCNLQWPWGKWIRKTYHRCVFTENSISDFGKGILSKAESWLFDLEFLNMKLTSTTRRYGLKFDHCRKIPNKAATTSASRNTESDSFRVIYFRDLLCSKDLLELKPSYHAAISH